MVSAGDAKKRQLGTINPTQLRIVTHSQIPSTNLVVGSQTLDDRKVSVAPVGLGECTSVHEVKVEQKSPGGKWTDSTEAFRVEPITKKVPAALWGLPSSKKPAINAKHKFVEAVTGIRLAPKNVPESHASQTVPTESVAWHRHQSGISPVAVGVHFWNEVSDAPGEPEGLGISDSVNTAGVIASRNQYLAALNIDPASVSVGGLSDRMLQGKPRRESISGLTA